MVHCLWLVTKRAFIIFTLPLPGLAVVSCWYVSPFAVAFLAVLPRLVSAQFGIAPLLPIYAPQELEIDGWAL
jgi:hypothetical protein